MAKRTRGSTTRSGQRRPAQRTPARPATTRPVVSPAESLSDEEEARAAELEAKLVAQERAVQQNRTRVRDRARVDYDERPRRGAGQSLLAVKSEEEYAYVVRDVRRIITVASGLLVIMAVLFVLIDVLHVFKVA